MTTGDIIDTFNDLHDERGLSSGDAALVCIACAIADVAYQIQYLGNGNASTSMGAIENLAKEIKEGLWSLTAAVESK